MNVTLPSTKVLKIKDKCSKLYMSHNLSIRDVASVIGLIVSTFPAVKFGPLHYSSLENDKIQALAISKGNFGHAMSLSKTAYDLRWWIDNVESSFNDMAISNPEMVIATDASSTGWGAVLGSTRTRGVWNLHEQQLHINVLELKAILYGLTSLIDQRNTHVEILTDNMNAVHSIKNMGSCRSLACNEEVKQIWNWAIQNQNCISVSFIPGVQNYLADAESRNYELRTEWQLNPSVFKFVIKKN